MMYTPGNARRQPRSDLQPTHVRYPQHALGDSFSGTAATLAAPTRSMSSTSIVDPTKERSDRVAAAYINPFIPGRPATLGGTNSIVQEAVRGTEDRPTSFHSVFSPYSSSSRREPSSPADADATAPPPIPSFPFGMGGSAAHSAGINGPEHGRLSSRASNSTTTGGGALASSRGSIPERSSRISPGLGHVVMPNLEERSNPPRPVRASRGLSSGIPESAAAEHITSAASRAGQHNDAGPHPHTPNADTRENMFRSFFSANPSSLDATNPAAVDAMLGPATKGGVDDNKLSDPAAVTSSNDVPLPSFDVSSIGHVSDAAEPGSLSGDDKAGHPDHTASRAPIASAASAASAASDVPMRTIAKKRAKRNAIPKQIISSSKRARVRDESPESDDPPSTSALQPRRSARVSKPSSRSLVSG